MRTEKEIRDKIKEIDKSLITYKARLKKVLDGQQMGFAHEAERIRRDMAALSIDKRALKWVIENDY